jgi:mannose-6-phosphate isomerase-like protein (cupin superfamily)
VQPSRRDIDLFLQLVEGGESLQFEDHERNEHLNQVIDKPWGHEYRIYVDSFYDIWKLTIQPGQMTSMHCHPRKEISLLCLGGRAKVRMLNQTRLIGEGEHVHFHRGTFHSTENIGTTLLELVEVEASRNKLDLVRLADKYGRQGTGYERSTIEGRVPPLSTCEVLPAARFRAKSMNGAYRFSVRSGAHIAARGNEGLLFAVDLGLGAAFHDVIHVVRGAQAIGRSFTSQAPFLTIETFQSTNEHTRKR